MDLFAPDPSANLLPSDGEVYYHGPALDPVEAERHLSLLLADTPWKSDEVMMFGKRIVTARKIAWYAETDRAYAYSGTVKEALPWTSQLLKLKHLVETRTGASYNSCLLNLYHDGTESMGWHSDDEKSLATGGSIASLSLGAARKFSFKHKSDKRTVSLILESGSLLEMKGGTQKHWHHQLPKSARVKEPRINLTFRTISTP